MSIAQSPGLVKSYSGSSPGWWAILKLVCSQARRNFHKNLLLNLETELLTHSVVISSEKRCIFRCLEQSVIRICNVLENPAAAQSHFIVFSSAPVIDRSFFKCDRAGPFHGMRVALHAMPTYYAWHVHSILRPCKVRRRALCDIALGFMILCMAY